MATIDDTAEMDACAYCGARLEWGEAEEAATMRTALGGRYFCPASPDAMHHLDCGHGSWPEDGCAYCEEALGPPAGDIAARARAALDAYAAALAAQAADPGGKRAAEAEQAAVEAMAAALEKAAAALADRNRSAWVAVRFPDAEAAAAARIESVSVHDSEAAAVAAFDGGADSGGLARVFAPGGGHVYAPVPGDSAVRVCLTHDPDLGLYGTEECGGAGQDPVPAVDAADPVG